MRINKKTERQINSIKEKWPVTATGAVSLAVDVYAKIIDAHLQGDEIIIEGKDGSRTRILI